jgi:hypothetical protein
MLDVAFMSFLFTRGASCSSLNNIHNVTRLNNWLILRDTVYFIFRFGDPYGRDRCWNVDLPTRTGNISLSLDVTFCPQAAMDGVSALFIENKYLIIYIYKYLYININVFMRVDRWNFVAIDGFIGNQVG